MINYYKYYYNLYKKGGSAFENTQTTSLQEVEEKTFTIWIRHELYPDRKLKFIGAGVPNAVYFDETINGVVKFRKGEKLSRNSFLRDSTIYNESIHPITSKETLSNFLEQSTEIKTYQNPEIIVNKVNYAYEMSNVIKELPSFLPITGFVLYSGFLTSSDLAYDHLKEKPFSIVFQKLDEITLPREKNKYLQELYQIIIDFEKLNKQFYTHGDLAKNCRNIITIVDKKLKVIDIDSIKPMFYKEKIQLNDIKPFFIDVLSLLNCLESVSEIKIPKIDLNLMINSEFISLLRMEDIKYIKDLSRDPYVEYVGINEAQFKESIKKVTEFSEILTGTREHSYRIELDYEKVLRNHAFVVNEFTKRLVYKIISKLYENIKENYEKICKKKSADTVFDDN